jgi:hypothetical protein
MALSCFAGDSRRPSAHPSRPSLEVAVVLRYWLNAMTGSEEVGCPSPAGPGAPGAFDGIEWRPASRGDAARDCATMAADPPGPAAPADNGHG